MEMSQLPFLETYFVGVLNETIFFSREEKFQYVGRLLKQYATENSVQLVTYGVLAFWCGRPWHLARGLTGIGITLR